MSDEAKAVQEIAKATGKVIDLATKTASFIARFISCPLEQGVGIYQDKLAYLRWERQIRLMQKAEELLKEVGLENPTRIVPLKTLVPLLYGASMEEDDELQDRWAALLVNAGNAESGINVLRPFVELLSQIDSIEARILDAVYALDFDDAHHKGISSLALPESAAILKEGDELNEEPSEEVALALSNLSRLGLLSRNRTVGGGEDFGVVNPTLFGRRFVEACRIKSD